MVNVATSQSMAIASTTSQIMEGFSLYENSIHKISIQYPSDWNKQEIFNNDYTTIDILAEV